MTWEPPADPNGVILSYHLNVSIDPRDVSYFTMSDVPIEIGADERTYVLEGLHPFIEYQLQLSARTRVGIGNRTAVMPATTLMAG